MIQSYLDAVFEEKFSTLTDERKDFFNIQHRRYGPDHFIFKIPSEISSRFMELFRELEQSKKILNVKSFKIAPSMLEEVFIKVIAELDDVSMIRNSLFIEHAHLFDSLKESDDLK